MKNFRKSKKIVIYKDYITCRGTFWTINMPLLLIYLAIYLLTIGMI